MLSVVHFTPESGEGGRGAGGNLCEVFFRLFKHQQWQKTSITKLLKMSYVSPDEAVPLL